MAALFGFAFMVLGLSVPPTAGGLADPGPLAPSHAGLACADCHRAAQDTSALFGQADASTVDSQLCLNCHDMGPRPHAAHGVADQALQPLTAFLAQVSGDSPVEVRSMECAACHQEHHGAPISPTMTDRQCETCHTTSFSPFATAHSEFALYPHHKVSERAIRFDHATHFAGHFAMAGLIGADAVLSCEDCHTLDPSNGAMLTLDAEASCMGCHESPLLDGAGLLLAHTSTESDNKSPLEILASAALMSRGGRRGDRPALEIVAQEWRASQWSDSLRQWAPDAIAAARVEAEASHANILKIRSESSLENWDVEPGSRWWRYRPTAHQDRFLTGLVETVARIASEGPEGLRPAALEALRDPGGLGRCTSCHRIPHPSHEAGSPWRSQRYRKHLGSVRFDHGPHLTDGQSCDSCHRIESDPWFAPKVHAPYESAGHPKFSGGVVDFEWMSARQCADCHNGERAPDQCASCHAYHMKRPTPR